MSSRELPVPVRAHGSDGAADADKRPGVSSGVWPRRRASPAPIDSRVRPIDLPRIIRARHEDTRAAVIAGVALDRFAQDLVLERLLAEQPLQLAANPSRPTSFRSVRARSRVSLVAIPIISSRQTWPMRLARAVARIWRALVIRELWSSTFFKAFIRKSSDDAPYHQPAPTSLPHSLRCSTLSVSRSRLSKNSGLSSARIISPLSISSGPCPRAALW